MPEIGLSGLLLDYPHSGSAVYTRNLVPLLPAAGPDLDFRLFKRWSGESFRGVAEQRLRTPFAPFNHGHGVGAQLDKLAWEIISLPLAAALRREVLLHSLYFAAPIVAAAPLVVTVHDLIPLILPGYHRTRQSRVYSQLMAGTARRAAAFITVSECSKRDIVQVLDVPEERVHVTYEAVDERFRPDCPADEGTSLREKYHLPERYMLYLGGAERRKNLEMLVRAWHCVVPSMRERGVDLVIVADFPPPDPLYPNVPGLVRELELQDSVHLIPRVDEADKPALYRAALAFCFPSRYEGFGFTPLEAMACGVPVLVSDAASLPEIVGQAAWLLSPGDERAWAEAMLRVTDSPAERQVLRERGLRQAGAFCWERTARQTVDVYRRVLGG
jgi:glycosyltransferase involved in cell wall biosynthesis